MQKSIFKTGLLSTVAIIAIFSSANAATTLQVGPVGGSGIVYSNTADSLTVNVTGVNPNPISGTATANTVNIFAIDGTGSLPSYNSDQYTVNIYATNGTNISNDLMVGGQITNADDIVLNADSGYGGYGGYGGVVLQKADNTLMEVNENDDGGTQIYTTTTMYDDLDMDGNQIHGVANGTSLYDAVNLNQLNGLENDMSGGIAAATAIANIPQVEAGKKASIGLGYGHYNGENAIAAGASWHFKNDGIMKVSVGSGGSGTTVGAGASWSW